MDEHIVDDFGIVIDQMVVEIEIALGRATAPARRLIFNADTANFFANLHFLMESGQALEQVFLERLAQKLLKFLFFGGGEGGAGFWLE